MRPPMRETVKLLSVADPLEKDRYGRPKTEPVISKARIVQKTRVALNEDGKRVSITVEISLPSHANPIAGMEIEYEKHGQTYKVTVIEVETYTNYGGDRVLYWCVACA